MSEKLHTSHEHLKPHHESLEAQQEKLKDSLEKASDAKHEHQEGLADIQRKIEHHAISGKEFSKSENEAPKAQHLFVTKELKKMTFDRTMARVQRKLRPTDRMLSKVVHQPVIDKVSDVSAKTIARPSALAGAGLVGFLASTGLYLFSRHYGYEYNYSTLLLFMAAGYIGGVLAESGFKLIRKAK